MKFIPAAVSRKAAMTVLKTKKHSPVILFAAGVVGMGATVVTASRATLHLEEVLEENERKVDLAHKNMELRADYNEAELKHDLRVLKVQAGLEIVKLYAPAVACGVVTLGCFTQAHRIQARRIAGLSAALAIVTDTFERYRERVREELGDEKDLEFYYGVEEETIREKTDSGTKTKKVKRLKGPSGYARWFDEYNPNHMETPSMNETFLRAQQEYANKKLQAQGFLFLNDVYEALGYEKTAAGQVVGWVYGRKRKEAAEEGLKSDGYVDFGFGDWPTSRDFAEGRERSVLLDFNVDGEVLKLMDIKI